MGSLTLYVDLMSQPCRALVIFCKANNIPFTQETTQIFKGQHRAPDFLAHVSPLGKLPAIVDGRFKLSESHAILKYLAATRPCPDHWYPKDVQARARVDMILDWHHSNLRRGAAGWLFQAIIAPRAGQPVKKEVLADAKDILCKSLDTLETVWLESPIRIQTAGTVPHPQGVFAGGFRSPTLADLSLACETLQLQLLGDDVYNGLLSDRPRVRAWLDAVRSILSPHFDDAHKLLRSAVARRRGTAGITPASTSDSPFGASGHSPAAPAPSSSSSSGAATGAGRSLDPFPEGKEMARLYSPYASASFPRQPGNNDAAQRASPSASDASDGSGMAQLYSPSASHAKENGQLLVHSPVPSSGPNNARPAPRL